MECNRDEAVRSREIAERKFSENDIAGAKRFALRAKALFEPLEGIDQMISALDVHIRAQTKIDGENDWYGILEVSTSDDDDQIKRQYKRLALQTHPDKNRFSGAEGAFKLISDAWSVFSDKEKRSSYDQKRFGGSSGLHQNDFPVNDSGTSSSTMSGMNSYWQSFGPATPTNAHASYFRAPDTFWTYCCSCQMSLQYSREYINRYLVCELCQNVFFAQETPPPTAPIYHNVANQMGLDSNMGGAQGTGEDCGNSQNCDPMQRPFFIFLDGADSYSHSDQQTHEPSKEEEVAEANAARSEEATLREHEQAGYSLGSIHIVYTRRSRKKHRREPGADAVDADYSRQHSVGKEKTWKWTKPVTSIVYTRRNSKKQEVL